MALAKEHIYKAFVSINIMAILFLLFSSSIIWQIYIHGQLKSLLEQYGFAKIPPAELPIGAAFSDTVVFALFVVWVLSLIICLFYSYHQLYLILQSNFKKQMYYSYRITVASILIPIFNLYRPWAGLSEIRKKLISRRTGDEKYEDYITIAFAVVFIISLALITIAMSDISVITKEAADYTSGVFDALIKLELVYILLVVFVSLITYIYCNSAINVARYVIIAR
jgi:hypothetical protein